MRFNCVLFLRKGMRRDPFTGAKKKVFGKAEADVPVQLAKWEPVAWDARFEVRLFLAEAVDSCVSIFPRC